MYNPLLLSFFMNVHVLYVLEDETSKKNPSVRPSARLSGFNYFLKFAYKTK